MKILTNNYNTLLSKNEQLAIFLYKVSNMFDFNNEITVKAIELVKLIDRKNNYRKMYLFLDKLVDLKVVSYSSYKSNLKVIWNNDNQFIHLTPRDRAVGTINYNDEKTMILDTILFDSREFSSHKLLNDNILTDLIKSRSQTNFKNSLFLLENEPILDGKKIADLIYIINNNNFVELTLTSKPTKVVRSKKKNIVLDSSKEVESNKPKKAKAVEDNYDLTAEVIEEIKKTVQRYNTNDNGKGGYNKTNDQIIKDLIKDLKLNDQLKFLKFVNDHIEVTPYQYRSSVGKLFNQGWEYMGTQLTRQHSYAPHEYGKGKLVHVKRNNPYSNYSRDYGISERYDLEKTDSGNGTYLLGYWLSDFDYKEKPILLDAFHAYKHLVENSSDTDTVDLARMEKLRHLMMETLNIHIKEPKIDN